MFDENFKYHCITFKYLNTEITKLKCSTLYNIIKNMLNLKLSLICQNESQVS